MEKTGNRYLAFRLALLFSIGFLFAGCGNLYHTRYTNDAIRIGESRESILKKFGRPYSEDLVYEDGKLTSIVCYKEPMAYGYTLKTFFYFQDSVLVRKVQVDDSPSKITLKESRE